MAVPSTHSCFGPQTPRRWLKVCCLAIPIGLAFSLLLGVEPESGQPSFRETEIKVPEGWRISDSSGVAVTERGFALPLSRVDDEGNPRSRIWQIAGPVHRYTDLDGGVGAFRYSPDGQHLLVGLLAAPEYEIVDSTTLLSAEGKVLWVKRDRRQFSFSTTGEVIVAWKMPFLRGASADYEVFSLDGTSLKQYTTGATLWREVFGRGDRALCGGRDWIAPFSGQTGLDTKARSRLPAGARPIVYVDRLSATRLIAVQEGGQFSILRSDGTIEYHYDPVALAAAHPEKTALDFAAYDPHQGQDPGTVVLFNRTRTVLVLEVSTGRLVPREFELTAPDGFRLITLDFPHNRVFYTSPTALRYRTFE